jgi:hypothetical protein
MTSLHTVILYATQLLVVVLHSFSFSCCRSRVCFGLAESFPRTPEPRAPLARATPAAATLLLLTCCHATAAAPPAPAPRACTASCSLVHTPAPPSAAPSRVAAPPRTRCLHTLLRTPSRTVPAPMSPACQPAHCPALPHRRAVRAARSSVPAPARCHSRASAPPLASLPPRPSRAAPPLARAARASARSTRAAPAPAAPAPAMAPASARPDASRVRSPACCLPLCRVGGGSKGVTGKEIRERELSLLVKGGSQIEEEQREKKEWNSPMTYV